MSQTHTIDRLKAVILVGSRDFGRCPLASRLNRALWPVQGKPALQEVLDELAAQGLRRFVISCESQSTLIQKNIHWDEAKLDVVFHEEVLPRGPAGCIRDAMSPGDELLLVLPANIVNPLDVQHMLDLHDRQQADMTVYLNPQSVNQEALHAEDSQIYMCSPAVLNRIPETGFFDLKEGLIPALVKNGQTIASASLPIESGHYRNWFEYTARVKARCYDQVSKGETIEGFSSLPEHPDVQVGSNVRISEKARFFGPVVIGSNTIIAGDAMVFGPSVIGEDVTIGPGCIIEESVIWDKATIGDQSRIRYSLVDAFRAVPVQSDISDSLVFCGKTFFRKRTNALQGKSIRKSIRNRFEKNPDVSDVVFVGDLFERKNNWLIGPFMLFLALAALIFSYWNPTVKGLIHIWLESDEYSSGLLVPLVAGYVLWARRQIFARIAMQPAITGLVMLLAAQVIRLTGLYFGMKSGERVAFIVSIGAIVLCLLGWRFFKKFTPIFLFLFLMLPLPTRVESNLTLPLQGWATVSSVFCLETLGFSVIREGNIIDINGSKVAVAEACNGLRMLTAFVVVSGLVTLVTKRKMYEKVLILLSSIPIALLCNTIRLTVTAIAFTKLDTERWEKIFHDFGGFAMMPLAVLLIVFELWLLSRVVIEPKKVNKQKQIIYRRETKE